MKALDAGFLGAALALAVLATDVTPALAKDGSKLSVSMQRVGTDPDVEGSMRFQSSSKGSRFEVRVKNAMPQQTLTLRVGGVDRHELSAGRNGSAKFSFRSGSAKKAIPLNFDPRGETVEVWQGGVAQLAAELAAGSGGQVSEVASLTSTGEIPGASGEARIRERKGVIDFDVEIEDVPNGSYDLFVEGVDRGDIVVSAGRGEIEFSDTGDDADELPLTFDPYGALIEVKQGATVILTGAALAGGGGGNVCTPDEDLIDLVRVGPDPDAKGDARHRVLDDCDRDFRVEIEDLPDGSYDLFVGGFDRGDIEVVDVGGEHQGEIEFHTDPSEVGKQLLSFDPRGQTIEVRQGATTFLSVSFPN
jgi:hypothetical protein